MECPLIQLSDVKVLLVDDERVSRLLVGNTLRRCGYQVSTAAGGEEAIQQLEKNPGAFSLILSDVMMPGIDGVQLLKYVRGNTLWDDVPVVMVSANEHESTVFECISNGAEDYLLKPVTKKEVQYLWQHVWRRQAANSSPTEDRIPEAYMVRSNQRTGVPSLDGNSFDVSNPQLLQPWSTCTPHNGARVVKSQPSGGVSGAAIACDSGSSMPMSGRVLMGPPTRLPSEESKGGLLGDSLLAQGTTGASGSVAKGPELNRFADIKGFKRFRQMEQPDECVRQPQQAVQGTMAAMGKVESDTKRGARSDRPLFTPKAWFSSSQVSADWPPEECPEGWVSAARVAEGSTAAPSCARGLDARPASSLDARASGHNSLSSDGLMRQQMASMTWKSGEQTSRSPACPRLPASLGLQSSVVQAWSDFTGGMDGDEVWAVRPEEEEARQQLAMENRQCLHLQSWQSGKQWRGSTDGMQQYLESKRQQWLYPSRSNSELKSLPSLSHSQQSQPGQSQHIEGGRAQIALNDQQLLLEQTQQMLNLCQEQGEELHRHKLFSEEDAELDETEDDGLEHGEFRNRSHRSCSGGKGSYAEKDRVQGSEQGWEDGEWNPHSAYGRQCQRQQLSMSRETGQDDGHSSRLFGASADGSKGASDFLDVDNAGRMGRGSRMSQRAQIELRLDEQVERLASSRDIADTKTEHFDEAVRGCRELAEAPEVGQRASAEAEPSVSERSDSPKPGLSESAVGSPSGGRSVMEGRLSDSGGASFGGRSLNEKVVGVRGSGMTLRQWFHRPGRTVIRRESLQILLQVVRMLSPMHAQGICSLKVRPSKLFLSSGKVVSFLDSKSRVSGKRQCEEKNAKVWHGRPSQVTELRRGMNVRGGEAVAERRNGEGGGVESSCHRRRENESGCVSAYGVYRGDGRDAVVLTEDGSASWRGEAGTSGDRSQEMSLWRVATPGPAVRGVRSQSGGGLWRGSGSEGGRSGSGNGSGRKGASSGQKSLDEGERRRRVEAAEQQWYSSPEELSGGQVSPASDMYSLGVFFFELLCPPMRLSDWARVMADLRHRILPPAFLSERPKEAAFCLWLLHPEPSSRPKARDVLGCDLMSEAVKIMAEQETEADLEEEGMEMEVLHDFLVEMQCGKETAASRLEEDLRRLTADIDEIHRRRTQMRNGCSGGSGGLELASTRSAEGVIPSLVQVDDLKQTGRKRCREQNQEEESLSGETAAAKRKVLEDGKWRGCSSGAAPGGKKLEQKCERVMNNFENLEEAYFSMRWKLEPRTEGGGGSSRVPGVGREAGAASGRVPAVKDVRLEHGTVSGPEGTGKGESADWLGCFFDSLCKFARYSKFEVKATLRHGDLLSTSNMVCSLSLDKDEEYFASAGVCKRVKIFGLESVLSDSVGIHYPVAEMASRSKLSCICWNSYIKSHIASSDYEGHVQLWDSSTGQPVVEYEEHEKRTWSVDFSRLDPKHLASGSDDGTVKLWSINQENSVATIKTKANVCCVQFSPDSAYTLAFGSADYKVYTYDWRHTRAPLAVFSGHRKAVSYVKFVDANTFVSASTDNTLKLWDLQKGISDFGGGLSASSDACVRTYTGHTNEKNFVGLTVADGYIACGSETNSVFAYHRSLPMPMASHQFGSTDPVTGAETDDDSGQFVSSVCWRGSTQTLVAANSMGNIKILEMV